MRFSTVRKWLLALIVVLYSVVSSLTLVNSDALTGSTIWVLLVVLGTLIIVVLGTLARKTVCGTDQTVAYEIAMMYAILPFAVITAFIVFTTEINPAPKYIALQATITAAAILHAAYSFFLVFVTIATHITFDAQVWSQNIEGSPSPFPAEILLNRLSRGLLCKEVSKLTSDPTAVREHSRHFCMPACQCRMSKSAEKNWRASVCPSTSQDEEAGRTRDSQALPSPAGSMTIPLEEEDAESGLRTAASGSQFTNSGQSIGSIARPRESCKTLYSGTSHRSSLASLVRLPDATERRSSIAVGFGYVEA